MLLGLVGFAMIFLVVYLLISGKVSPMVIFVAVPFVAALICGFTPAQIFEFMKKGVTTTMNTAVLFLFSIVYFSIMNDVGLFDPFGEFSCQTSRKQHRPCDHGNGHHCYGCPFGRNHGRNHAYYGSRCPAHLQKASYPSSCDLLHHCRRYQYHEPCPLGRTDRSYSHP